MTKWITCDFCGQRKVRLRRITRSYGKGKTLFVIENIPVLVCSNCGQSYFEAKTLHELERMKLHRQSLSTSRQIPIASFR